MSLSLHGLHSVIGSEISRHPLFAFNQMRWNLKNQLRFGLSRFFALDWDRSRVFSPGSHWLHVIFCYDLIGRDHYFRFGFTTLIGNVLFPELEIKDIEVMFSFSSTEHVGSLRGSRICGCSGSYSQHSWCSLQSVASPPAISQTTCCPSRSRGAVILKLLVYWFSRNHVLVRHLYLFWRIWEGFYFINHPFIVH